MTFMIILNFLNFGWD